MSEARDCGGDVGAYLLDALEPVEEAAFRAHLETCAACREELASIAPVLGVLPMAAPEHPAPRRLRRNVMRAIQEPPATSPRRTRTARRWPQIPRAAVSGLAGLAAALAVVAGIELSSGGSNSTTRVIAATVVGSHGSAQLRLASTRAELLVRDFPAPPPGKIYEVWLLRPNQPPAPTSALFGVTASGDGEVVIPGELRGISEVLVTPEPAGGTLVPTHAPVIIARIT